MKSKPLFNIFILFSVILLLIFGVYHFLQRGISLSKLEFGNVAIEGFYLILDKKLNLTIQSITIKQATNASETSSTSLQENLHLGLRIIKNIKTLHNLIGIVSIEQIVYDDFKGSLLLQNDIISADFPHWRLRINLYDDTSINSLQIHVTELTYTPYNASITGLINYDISKQQIHINSVLSFDETITLYTEFKSDFRDFTLEAQSENFVSLQPFAAFTTNKQAKLWLNQIQGDFSLNKLSLAGKLQGDMIQNLRENLFAELQIKQGSVVFDDSLNPMVFEQANILYHKNFAQAYFINPSYEKIPLDGSNVTLQNVFNNPLLSVQILSHTRLNKTIHQVLNTFDIHLPLNQKSGKIDANVSLNIPLGKGKMDIIGTFITPHATFDISGQELTIDNATIWLKNGIVAFEDLTFATEQTLNANGQISLLIDTNTKTLQGKAYLENLAIEPEAGVFVLHESFIPINGDFSGDSTIITLPTLEIECEIGQSTTIFIHNFNQLVGYSALIADYAASGNAKLQIDDSNIGLQILLSEHNLPLRTHDNQELKPLILSGNIRDGNVQILSADSRLSLATTKEKINIELQDLNVQIAAANTTKSSSNTPSTPIAARGKNLNLDIKGRKIFAQSLQINRDEKGNLTGEITNGNSVFTLQYNGTLLSILGTRLNDKILNSLLATNALDGGVYALLAEYQQDIFKANLTILKGTIKDLVGLQNMIAFIDTIPSLLMFKAPGFDQDGYQVESGSIDVELSNETLFVRKVELNGDSLDISGKGKIMLSDNRLDLQLKLSTFKALGTVLSNIPIVNFVIMGDDGSFTTHIHVTGTLQKPEFGFSVLQDTLQDTINAPKNLIERTLEIPADLLR